MPWYSSICLSACSQEKQQDRKGRRINADENEYNAKNTQTKYDIDIGHKTLTLNIKDTSICCSYMQSIWGTLSLGRSTWHVELKGHLTFFSLLALSWTCCVVWRCSSVNLATASPSCLHSRGFCSPNSCTDTPNSARVRLQHSHSSQRACKTREESKNMRQIK